MLDILQHITDHRRPQGRRYELKYIVFFAILAIISNAKTYREIATFTQEHFKRLKKVFKLKWKRPPAYTTIRLVIKEINTYDLEIAFRTHAKLLCNARGKVISFDGKTLRGSFDKFSDREAIHVLKAFCVEDAITLGHLSVTEDKTNEIPKFLELIEELGLTDCLVTADALHCQKKTVDKIQDTKNSGIIQVKKNQPSVLKACEKICNSYNPMVKENTLDQGHGRGESRTTYWFGAESYLKRHLPKVWKGRVNGVICVVRERTDLRFKGKKGRNHEATIERSYYLAIGDISPEKCGEAIRKHWHIENRLNYVKDVTLGEDESRIRSNPHNMMVLRDFALNVLRTNGVKNIRNTIFKNSLNLDNALTFMPS